MKKLPLSVVVSALFLASLPLHGASRLQLYYNQLESVPDGEVRETSASFPVEGWYNFSTMDPSEEIPTLRKELESKHQMIRFLSASQLVMTAIAWSNNKSAMASLRDMAPQVGSHFQDTLQHIKPKAASEDAWKRIVFSFFEATQSTPSPDLLQRMVATLPNPRLLEIAADTLARLRPLPVLVHEALLARVSKDTYSRGVIVQALGKGKVDDADALRVITESLFYQPSEPESVGHPQYVNGVHQAAANALAQIGQSARGSVAALRAVLQNPNEDPETKGQVKIALERLESSPQ